MPKSGGGKNGGAPGQPQANPLMAMQGRQITPSQYAMQMQQMRQQGGGMPGGGGGGQFGMPMGGPQHAMGQASPGIMQMLQQRQAAQQLAAQPSPQAQQAAALAAQKQAQAQAMALRAGPSQMPMPGMYQGEGGA